MKKLIRAIVIVGIIIAIPIVYFQQSRDFYCLSEDKCITVWKRMGGTCYVIPGKYYGVIKPSDNYIETTNTNDLTIYFSDTLSGALIIRREQKKKERDMSIVNHNKQKMLMLDYDIDTVNFHNNLYKPNARYRKDVKDNTNYISVNIKEGYAKDKSGKKL